MTDYSRMAAFIRRRNLIRSIMPTHIYIGATQFILTFRTAVDAEYAYNAWCEGEYKCKQIAHEIYLQTHRIS